MYFQLIHFRPIVQSLYLHCSQPMNAPPVVIALLSALRYTFEMLLSLVAASGRFSRFLCNYHPYAGEES